MAPSSGSSIGQVRGSLCSSEHQPAQLVDPRPAKRPKGPTLACGQNQNEVQGGSIDVKRLRLRSKGKDVSHDGIACAMLTSQSDSLGHEVTRKFNAGASNFVVPADTATAKIDCSAKPDRQADSIGHARKVNAGVCNFVIPTDTAIANSDCFMKTRRDGESLEVDGRTVLPTGSVFQSSRSNADLVVRKQGDETVVSGVCVDDATASRHCQKVRLLSLNVDGCGHYRMSPADRMDSIITVILDQKPDVIALQEVTSEMQVALQRRLRASDWSFYRRKNHSEDYFTLRVSKTSSGMSGSKSTSYLFPQTSNGRRLVKVRSFGLTTCNVHAESGSQRRARAERESQLEYMSGIHEHDEVDRPCVLVGDVNVREGEDACLHQAGWRDAWALAKGELPQAWTWKHHNEQHTARYDCVYIHSSSNVSVECLEYGVMKQIWGTLTDHCALRVVLQCKYV